MSDERSEHKKLVEDVTQLLDDMMSVLDQEKVAREILTLILSRLHDVTPEMVEAGMRVNDSAGSIATRNVIIAALAVSPLNGGK